MTTPQATDIQAAYAKAFGEEHAEELIAPNYMANEEFHLALQHAVQVGVPLSIEAAERCFGERFWRGHEDEREILL